MVVFGAVIFFEILNDLAYTSKRDFKGERTIFLTLEGHKEDIEYTLRGIIHEHRKENSNCEIICMDLGLDSETRRICELFSRDFHFVKLVDFK